MKKKLLICLAMLVGILGLTACGQEMTENSFTTKEDAALAGEELCLQMAQMNDMLAGTGVGMAEYVEMNGGNPDDAAVYIAAMDSWKNAAEEFGSFVSVVEGGTEVTLSNDKATAKVKIQGDKIYKGNKERTATVEIIMTKKEVESISVSINYDMSELMVRAALNTLLGMGTVFAVLILISIIISWFNYIPKVQAMFEKKPAQPERAPAPAVRAADPVVEAVEETDDTELIAVIAAAIAAASAASGGAASADGYVVRSIIRR